MQYIESKVKWYQNYDNWFRAGLLKLQCKIKKLVSGLKKTFKETASLLNLFLSHFVGKKKEKKKAGPALGN